MLSRKLKYYMILVGFFSMEFASAASFATDTFTTRNNKKVSITFIKHGSLMLSYGTQSIQVDPVSQFADYAAFPKADVILITHEHADHLDAKAIDALTSKSTVLIANEASRKKIGRGVAMKNGDKRTVLKNITIEAVPAYNTTSGREIYHPRHRDNGYVITIDGLRIYIAGDTEDIPEMKALKNIYVAFLPVNQPYTMTVSQTAKAARMFNPKILYPYHFGNTDIEKLKDELKGSSIEVRFREMQ